MYTDITDLAVNIAPHVAGCPTNLLYQQLRFAARDFFGRTEVWTSIEEDIDIVASQADYTLTTSGTSGDIPEIRRIVWAKNSGVLIDPEQYYFSAPTTLTFYTDYVPTVSVADGLDVKLVFVPTVTHTDYDQFVLDKWHAAIEEKALERLFMVPNRPWTSPEQAAYHRREYNRYFLSAKKISYTGYKSGSLQAQGHEWV